MFEFTFDSFSDEQRDAYLARIGFREETSVCKQTLDRLVYLHQCSVPFEDLDPVLGVDPLPLDAQSLFDKIVTRRRGGFCFELNGAFMLLLRAIGFDAYSCVCRVAAFSDQFGALSHRGTIIRLNGKKYFCDVGFGGSMAPFAVEISSERQTLNGETSWIEELEEGWYLQRRLDREGEEKNCVIFSLQPFLPMDFDILCRFLMGIENFTFRMILIANLRTPDGAIQLEGDQLTIRKGDVVTKKIFPKEELDAVLKEYFGIILPPHAPV